MTTSSCTSSSVAISTGVPFLIAVTRGIFSNLRLSRICLDLISCAIPITVFAATMNRNVRSLNCPTIISKTASTANMRLKYVSTFSLTISLTVLVDELTSSFTSPRLILSSTSRVLKPSIYYFSQRLSMYSLAASSIRATFSNASSRSSPLAIMP